MAKIELTSVKATPPSGNNGETFDITGDTWINEDVKNAQMVITVPDASAAKLSYRDQSGPSVRSTPPETIRGGQPHTFEMDVRIDLINPGATGSAVLPLAVHIQHDGSGSSDVKPCIVTVFK